MFKRIFDWFKGLFKSKPVSNKPAPKPVTPGPAPKPVEDYAFEWDNVYYDKYLVDALKKSKLLDLVPADKRDFGLEPDPIWFWGKILAKMAYYESKWNPEAKYEESFRDRNGKRIWSRGLFQLSIESGRGYDRSLESEESLHDPKVNIELAVKIMDKLANQNGRIAGKVSGKWQGGARYWSVLRGEREYTRKALAAIKSVNQVPEPTKPTQPIKPSPKKPKGKKMNLWATFYYLPKMNSDKEGVELRDMKGNKLGYKLANNKFCNLAMQGSGVVDGVVIGYQGRGKTKQASCSYEPSNYVRFHKDPNKYGTGVRNWAITPFKSIAVDPKWIPYGSVVYIPDAVGVKYTFEGEEIEHDGIFYAQDTGGKIKTNHIDVYLGPVDSVLGNWRDALNANPFKFIKSTESGTFEAYILDEDQDPDDLIDNDDRRDNIDEDKPDDGGDDRDYDKFPEDEEKLWYPKALRSSYKMRTRGTYKNKYPQGAVVHFTAGRSRNRSEGGSKNTETHLAQGKRGVVSAANKGSFAYFIIDRAGNVHQNFPLDRWGYHAGTSAWKGLSGSVSDELVGIEIQNAGKLSDTYKNSSEGKSYKCPEGKLAAWFTRPRNGDKFFDKETECRYHKGEDNIAKGWYHKYSPEQEEALLELLIWMKRNNPDVFDIDLILGHDEVAGPKGIGRWRKVDPGASLSMTMTDFRKKVLQEYDKRYK